MKEWFYQYRKVQGSGFRLASCVLLFTFCILPAYGRGVGTSGSSVLKLGLGAKSTSMGEANVAVADDISSIYWNPAGLYQIQNSQLSAMHVEWLGDIRYEWVAFAQPLGSWATIAADILYLHMGSIPRTVELPTGGYEEDGTFTAADFAGRIAFASEISGGILVGASFQILQSTVDFRDVTKEAVIDREAQSTSLGLGCLYSTPIPDLKVGASFQNWGRRNRAFVKEKAPLPFVFRIGASYQIAVTQQKDEGVEEEQETDSSDRSGSLLVIATDLNFSADDSFGARIGGEYKFGSGIAIRTGYRAGAGFDFPSGLCGGAGYSTDTYQLDYAFVPYGDVGSTHRISFTVRF
jgi:hypothetical protein